MKPTTEIVPTHLHQYLGMRPRFEDQWRRAHMLAFTSQTQLLAARETAFSQMAWNSLLLNDETYDLIYGENDGTYGFIDEPYRPGSHPMLERYIDFHTHDGMSDLEKVIALNQSTSKLPNQFGTVPAFLYGESDEETLLKGGGHCSCQGRLLAALCQILGLQARPMLMWVTGHPDNVEKMIGGHTVTEVFLDGKWCFFDPSMHWYLTRKDGSLPSLLELRDNPDMIDDLSDEQWRALDIYNRQIPNPKQWLRENYFGNYCHRTVSLHASRHDVNGDYTPHWTWATEEFVELRKQDAEPIKQIAYDLARKGQLTHEIYQLDIEAFRERFGIRNANLHPPQVPFVLQPSVAVV